MNPGQPSRTAEEVAIHRAAHQVLDAPRIFDDPLALRVISIRARLALLAKPMQLRTDPEIRAVIALRSRCAEDELASAVRASVRQYVILGAGLDTFAYRNPYTESCLRVFEVDHPATQSWKRQRLQQAGIAIPDSIVFAPLDFGRQTLAEALRMASLHDSEPTFFSMLGVAIFLSKATVLGVLDLVASLPAGSGIVFDYGMSDSSLIASQRAVRERAARASASVGEPFISFFDPPALAAQARQMGFKDVDDFGFEEANIRYFSNRTDGLHVGSSGRRIIGLRR